MMYIPSNTTILATALDWTTLQTRRSLGDACPIYHTQVQHMPLYNVMAFIACLLFGNSALVVRALNNLGVWNTPDAPSNSLTSRKGIMKVSMLAFTASLAWQVGMTYFTAHLSQNGDGNNAAAVFRYFELWALRPRATPFIMILGFVHTGWLWKAWTSVVIDWLVCALGANVAATLVVAKGNPSANADYGDIEGALAALQQPIGWPAWRVGALITLILTILFVLGILPLLFIVLGGQCLTCCELCVQMRRLCFCCPDEELRGFGETEWSWEGFAGTWWMATLIWLAMYIGRWMLWAGLPDELQRVLCPGEVKKVDLIWSLGPYAVQPLMTILGG
jgi:hypothetical protein